MSIESLESPKSTDKISKTYKGNIFKFVEGGYEISTPPLSYHIFQYLSYGENYFHAAKLSESQRESYREYAKILAADQREFRAVSLAWLGLASHKVMRVGHSLLCWSTPEDDDRERLLLADFRPDNNSLDGTNALVLLKSYRKKDPTTNVSIEKYTDYPLMLVHRNFSDEVERFLQQITRHKEELRLNGVESYFDYETYSCMSKTRKVVMRKYDSKDSNAKKHRLYNVEVLDLVKNEEEDKVFTKKQIIATIHEDNLKRRANAYLAFAVFYGECARMLKDESIKGLKRNNANIIKVSFADNSEEMCQMSALFNPTMAKVLVNCLRIRKIAKLKANEPIRYLPSSGYLRLHKNLVHIDGKQQLGPKSQYKFYIDTIDEDLLFETNYPVVALQAYVELSRMYAGCQELFDRPDPSLNVRIKKQELDGKGNFIEEESIGDLQFDGKVGRSGRTQKSLYIHKKLKAEAEAGKDDKELEQLDKPKKKKVFKAFWKL